LGAQFGNNAASGLLYPTAFRSRGVGWALGVGRFGSIVGPMLGGILIGMKVSLPRLFLFAAVPMVIGFICSLGAARLSYTRLGGVQLDDVSQRIAGDIDIVDSHSPQK
jgi:MFS transporter, AAHS family, 4-hydroxybenzoate transporter